MPPDHSPAPRAPAPADPVPAARPPRDALPPGTLLGDSYRVERTLGQGGFGVVYLATDLALQRPVAIKEYLPVHLAGRGDGTALGLREAAHQDAFVRGLQSFLNEARLLAQFDHPSLVRVYRFWEENHTAYMAMPFCDGPTLTAARRSMLRPPDERWLREQLLLPLLGALDTLHAASCLHRDVSPDNILLLADGRPVLLDFGSARRVVADMTQPLTAVLNPSYAAIEQFAESTATPQGPWTDLYGLGCVAYYALSGRAPAPATARAVSDSASMPAAEVGRLLEQSFPGLHYSPTLLAAIDSALALRPTDRPQSAADLRAMLMSAHVQPDLAIEPPSDTRREEVRLSAVPMPTGSDEEPLSEEEERAIRNVIDIALGDAGRGAAGAGRPTRIEPRLEPVPAPPSPFAPSPIVPPPRKAALKVVASGPWPETPFPAADAPAKPPTARPVPAPVAPPMSNDSAAVAVAAPSDADAPRDANPLWPLDVSAPQPPAPTTAGVPAVAPPPTAAQEAAPEATTLPHSEPSPSTTTEENVEPRAAHADTWPEPEPTVVALDAPADSLPPSPTVPAAPASPEPELGVTQPAVRLVSPPPPEPFLHPSDDVEDGWVPTQFAADDDAEPAPPPRTRKTALGAVAVAAAALAAVGLLRLAPAALNGPDDGHVQVAQAPVAAPAEPRAVTPAATTAPPAAAPAQPAAATAPAVPSAGDIGAGAAVTPAAHATAPATPTTTPSEEREAAPTRTTTTPAQGEAIATTQSPVATPTPSQASSPARVEPPVTTAAASPNPAPTGSKATASATAPSPGTSNSSGSAVVASHGLHPFKPRANASGTSSAPTGAASPRAACGKRQNFALYYCMKAQCRQPRYFASAECKRLREDDEL